MHCSKKRLRAKLSRDSVQSHARIKAELALCLLRGEISARLSDVVDTATRLLDRQHRCPGYRIDVQRRRLCRVSSGSGVVEMPIAEDHSNRNWFGLIEDAGGCWSGGTDVRPRGGGCAERPTLQLNVAVVGLRMILFLPPFRAQDARHTAAPACRCVDVSAIAV